MQWWCGQKESFPNGVVQYQVLYKMKHSLKIPLALAFHQRPIFYQYEQVSSVVRKTKQKVSNSNTCEK